MSDEKKKLILGAAVMERAEVLQSLKAVTVSLHDLSVGLIALGQGMAQELFEAVANGKVLEFTRHGKKPEALDFTLVNADAIAELYHRKRDLQKRLQELNETLKAFNA